MGRPNPSRETKFSGANGARKIFVFPVQLTTRRTGNLAQLMDIPTYLHTYYYVCVFDHDLKHREHGSTGYSCQSCSFVVISFSSFSSPDNLLSRDGFGRPSPSQLAHHPRPG